MKYIALIYANPANEPKFGTPEFAEYMKGYKACNETYAADGVLLGGEALRSTDVATTVRVRGGKTSTMDGPFIETKEQLGGYYLLDCPDLDSAIRYAAMIPTAKFGSVEIRPIADVSGLL
ncbi:MAG: YciI family protein [Nitratireductor sp.]